MSHGQKILGRSKAVARLHLGEVLKLQQKEEIPIGVLPSRPYLSRHKGSWKLSKPLEELIGIPLPRMQERLRSPNNLPDDVNATLLAVSFCSVIIKNLNDIPDEVTVVKASWGTSETEVVPTNSIDDVLSKFGNWNEDAMTFLKSQDLKVDLPRLLAEATDFLVTRCTYNGSYQPAASSSRPQSIPPSLRSKFLSLQAEWDPEKRVDPLFVLQEDEENYFTINCHHITSKIQNTNRRASISAPTFLWCEGCEVEHKVKVLQSIGKGSFAEVYHCMWGEEECAMKLFSPQISDLEQGKFLNELSLMSKMSHENIIRLKCASIRPPNYCLVMERAHRGDLFTLLHELKEPLPLSTRLKIAKDIAQGMAYLHGIDIVHLDLKPLNVLVMQDWTAKIADFSVSINQRINESLKGLASPLGTPVYMSPEMYLLLPCTRKHDVYSFGILLWELITGQSAYEEDIAQEGHWKPVVDKVAKQGKRPPLLEEHPKLCDLLVLCWNADPTLRPTFPSLISDLDAIIGS